MLAGIFITVFGVIGAANVIKWAVVKITATGDASNRLYGVILKGENADIELQLAIEMFQWDNSLKYVRAYAIDCGIDESCRSVCLDLCQNSRFRLVTPGEFYKILNENNL